MERQLKATGLFWGLVFLAGGVINFVSLVARYKPWIPAVTSDLTWLLCLAVGGVFCVSAYVRPLAWAQPIIMMGMTPLPFLTTHESFYGLGFFTMSVILLFRLGFYERHRVPKFIASIAYLFGCELFAVMRNGEGLYYSLTPIFFISIFLAFLYFSFQEKLAVFLKEPKPVYKLKEKGLSAAEVIYVKAVAQGHSPKEIAVDYNVSESTVRNSLSRAYKKLEIEDKTAIVALAERYQIVE